MNPAQEVSTQAIKVVDCIANTVKIDGKIEALQEVISFIDQAYKYSPDHKLDASPIMDYLNAKLRYYQEEIKEEYLACKTDAWEFRNAFTEVKNISE